MNINAINSLTSFKGKISLYRSPYSVPYDMQKEIDADKIVQISRGALHYKVSDNNIKIYPCRNTNNFLEPTSDEDYTRFLSVYAAAKVADPDVVIYA